MDGAFICLLPPLHRSLHSPHEGDRMKTVLFILGTFVVVVLVMCAIAWIAWKDFMDGGE